MRGVPNTTAREEVLRLRIQERLSFREIQERTGVAKSSLSRWLQDHPLSEEEVLAKCRVGITKPRVGTKKPRGGRSPFDVMVGDRKLLPSEKGQIAEAAVLFRLTLHGLHVMSPVFDGGRTDWLVQTPANALAKIQVKWASSGAHGLPHLSLTCSDGHSKRRRYSVHEYDFIIGYHLYADTAYVFSSAETAGNATVISVREEAAERWDKVLEFGAVVQREGTALAAQK